MVNTLAYNLFTNTCNERARARLLASAIEESGTWLNVTLHSSFHFFMDNATIRTATHVGLRLGAPYAINIKVSYDDLK